MIKINLTVGALLDGDATVKALAGSSIYPVTFPQKKLDSGIPFPSITYSRTVSPPDNLCPGSESAIITIQAFAESYKKTIEMAEAVKEVMEVNAFFMESCVDDYFFPAFIQRMTFKKSN